MLKCGLSPHLSPHREAGQLRADGAQPADRPVGMMCAPIHIVPESASGDPMAAGIYWTSWCTGICRCPVESNSCHPSAAAWARATAPRFGAS